MAGGKVGDVCKNLSKPKNVEAVGNPFPWEKIARDIGTDESPKSHCVPIATIEVLRLIKLDVKARLSSMCGDGRPAKTPATTLTLAIRKHRVL
jgi:hypothetical protein